tara:strand:- start:298 stop:483 length:186 start_codon:yes stop_codon:yes gene_type:complete
MLTDEELLIIHQVLDEHIDNISDKSLFEGDFEETDIVKTLFKVEDILTNRGVDLKWVCDTY